MTISELPTTGPRASFWRLALEEEDAQAVPELVVLLPVYLFLITMAIYVGHFSLIRQQVSEVSRYHAWANEARLTDREFFPTYANFGRGGASVSPMRSPLGSYTMAAIDRDSSGSNQGKTIYDAALGTGSGDEVAVAFAKNDVYPGLVSNASTLTVSGARVRFDYRHPWFVGRWVRDTFSFQREQYVVRRTVELQSGGGQQRLRFGYREPFHFVLYALGSSPPGNLPNFDIYSEPWQPIVESQGGSFQLPRDGKGLDRKATVWNRTHRLNGGGNTNPFYRRWYR